MKNFLGFEKEWVEIYIYILLHSSLALEQSSFYNMSSLYHHFISLPSLRIFKIDFKEVEVKAIPSRMHQYIWLLAAGSDSK